MLGPELVSFGSLPSLPGWLLVLLATLAVVQVVLDLYSLLDLWRRPGAEVAINRWIWTAIILLVNPLGAILYLLIGRRPGPPVEQGTQAGAGATRTSEIVDSLYGPPKPQP